MKRALLFLLIAGSLCFNLQAQAPVEKQAAEEVQQREHSLQDPQEINAKLRIAASTHEIILALIADHDYESVFAEFKKILDLELGGELESSLAEATWVIVDELRLGRQFALAHKIVDSTLAQVSDSESRFSLFILKGQTYKDQGRNRDAVRIYREAQKIQN